MLEVYKPGIVLFFQLGDHLNQIDGDDNLEHDEDEDDGKLPWQPMIRQQTSFSLPIICWDTKLLSLKSCLNKLEKCQFLHV